MRHCSDKMELGFSSFLGSSVLRLLGLCLLAALPLTLGASSFSDLFTSSGDNEHVMVASGGQSVQLVLDQKAGSGFVSKDKFLFGNFSTQIKLVRGDSAGTVVTYYMTSNTSANDEIDFEFLGNSSGQPYELQTNVFANSSSGREQRTYLWFDPTTNFHSYTIVWNQAQIAFYVDSVPIRLYKNNADLGVPFPSTQPMKLYSTIWNGDQWATRGGAVKLNWTHAPFISTYKNFQIDACVASGSSSAGSCSNWKQGTFETLSDPDKMAMQAARQKYMTYDYCTDTRRYPTPPPECARNAA